jgi:hypothetical protein
VGDYRPFDLFKPATRILDCPSVLMNRARVSSVKGKKALAVIAWEQVVVGVPIGEGNH